MSERIQIPLRLYELMVSYIQDHYDPADIDRFIMIQRLIEEKQKAKLRHNLYSAYKKEKDPNTREMLRGAYLDEAGIPSHGRWTEEAELDYRNGNFI